MNRLAHKITKSGGLVVSEGTLLTQDLVPKFLHVLSELSPEAYAQMQTPGCGFQAVPSYALEDKDSEWWDSEECSTLLNETLWDALNEHAPEGFWFGSYEGDGACFGFWLIEEESTE